MSYFFYLTQIQYRSDFYHFLSDKKTRPFCDIFLCSILFKNLTLNFQKPDKYHVIVYFKGFSEA